MANRADQLRDQATKFTGIDFVHVVDPCDQTKLRIYLVTDALQLTTPFHAGSGSGGVPLRPQDIRIEDADDPNAPPIEVLAIDEVLGPPEDPETGNQVLIDAAVDRQYLGITVSRPGDFSRHRLHIEDPHSPSRVDRFFNDHVFSFKVACPDRSDCLAPEPVCPPDPGVDFPVDYLARDFVSLRNALLEYGAQRYPDWSMPIEADVGVMLTEAMAALGDELSYIQDRYAREAYLETATQRRSVRRKVRLLDFEMHDGRAATTLLEIRVRADADDATENFIRAGSRVYAVSESLGAIPFEVGRGLVDTPPDETETVEYEVHADWNAGAHPPHIFDDSVVCLDVGATEMFVEEEITSIESLINDPDSEDPPRWVLLRSARRQHFVRLIEYEQFIDEIPEVKTVVRLRWDTRDALPFQMDLEGFEISFNVVPATAGERKFLRFSRAPAETLPTDVEPVVHPACEREGPLRNSEIDRERLLTPEEAQAERVRLERPPIVFFGLIGSDTTGIGFLGEALRHTLPEVQVIQDPDGERIPWIWHRSLIDADSTEQAFTLEDGIWTRVRSFSRLGTPFLHQDYATGEGFSVRFGDGEFGSQPPPGVVFEVVYRTAPGATANVPAGSVNALSLPDEDSTDDDDLDDFDDQDWIESASNPMAVTSGVDRESVVEAKQLASEAYQVDKFFAVRPRDYGVQAEKLGFVQRAQGTSRWTGSWPSIFVAADPFDSLSLTAEQKDELEGQMDCVRQMGRDVIVRDPKTVALDLQIFICLYPNAHASAVLTQLNEVMFGPGTNRRLKGFFHPDNFSFGTPLRRSALEAAVQSVPGVQAVMTVNVRQRGLGRFRAMRELVMRFSHDQILRLENDPARPEGGTLQFQVRGGV